MAENITVTLTYKKDYRFEVDFHESFRGFVSDVGKPDYRFGSAHSHLLLAAVANCLSVSFLHFLNRSGIEGRHTVTKAI